MDFIDYALFWLIIVVLLILLFQILKLLKNTNAQIQKDFKNRFNAKINVNNSEKAKLKNRSSIRIYNSLYIRDENELNELRKKVKKLPWLLTW